MLNKARSYLPVLLVVALLFSQHAHGRPYRRKRTSDQRLAEIQTYLALSKMKGEIKNVPVAFGIVDLNHISFRKISKQTAPLFNLCSSKMAERNNPVIHELLDCRSYVTIGRRRRSLKRSLKNLMNSSRQESIADDVLTNDPNENLNDLLTRLDQDNRAEWQYDWDIYPSVLIKETSQISTSFLPFLSSHLFLQLDPRGVVWGELPPISKYARGLLLNAVLVAL
uniref:Uncharacterized protein n=1 Tax=Timema bartmani TaxID=61472 RepID=A0A7R9F0Z4_9NEOP|nr:unnamed protein product [Timema bartmani]